MDIRELLLEDGWSEDEALRLAQGAAERLSASGLQRDAILVWLDQIRMEPRRFLADPGLADLARLWLSRQEGCDLAAATLVATC